jgi:uncharacterized damage-inducible protein DinB
MDYDQLIDQYLDGPRQLREAVTGMTQEQLSATPVPGKWSTRQVVCHLADYEPIFADRMKRVIAEDEPPISSSNHQAFANRLAYDQRDVDEELTIIQVIRSQMSRILRSLEPKDFQRNGHHSTRGPMTLESLLQQITEHIPHHVKFIEEKKEAMVG